MKNLVSFKTAVLIVSATIYGNCAIAQNYNAGTGSGTLGVDNTFVGSNSGNAAAAGASDNAFFGASSGRFTTNGDFNAFFGSETGQDNTTGSYNTFIGRGAGTSNTTGVENTFLGWRAGNEQTTGSKNVFLGYGASYYNQTASENVAIGYKALYENISGTRNVAIGFQANGTDQASSINKNDITVVGYLAATFNLAEATTAFGSRALTSNSTGIKNSAFGLDALRNNTTGGNNAAFGNLVLSSNTTASFNTAMGSGAMKATTTGGSNTAVGSSAMALNTTGSNNTAVGDSALVRSTTGIENVALGTSALVNNTTGQKNVAIGVGAGLSKSTNQRCIFIGGTADASGSSTGQTNSIALGFGARVNSSSKIRFGNSFISVVEGQVAYSIPSDGRFKSNVKEDVPGLEFIKKLRPVTYNFDRAKFSKHIGENQEPETLNELNEQSKQISTGFIAQEVEAVAKDLGYYFDGLHVADKDNANDNYSLAYSQFTVPLVKAVQELDVIQAALMENESEQELEMERLKNENAQMKNEIAEMRSCLETLCNSLDATGISPSDDVNDGSFLSQNNPNPFKESTTIGFSISSTASKAVLRIFSMTGVELKSFEISTKGKGQIEIAGNTLTPGVYAYVLIVDNKTVDTKQMVVTR